MELHHFYGLYVLHADKMTSQVWNNPLEVLKYLTVLSDVPYKQLAMR